MTKTKKNPHKEQREWNELLHEKKAYILRKQEAEDALKTIREFNQAMDDMLERDTGDTPQ